MGVWIDTDMGFDDIAAILAVMHHGTTIDGISLCFGNAPLAQVRRNAAGAAKAFGWTCPIHTGREKPVLAKLETATAILGETGIPTMGLSLPEAADLPQSNAFNALCDWLSRDDETKRILALGPLSNIAALALARPDLAAKIDELVWMGGGLTRGNHTASAEFNALADAEALAIALAHNLPFKMVDLDFCRKITASMEDAAPIRAAMGKNAALLADLTAGFINIAVSRGRDQMALYDPAAAVAFLRPDLVTFEPAFIGVELSGTLTRGRTVVETRASHAAFNAAYAADCNANAIRCIILDALKTEAAKP
ncbi:nucleoside hydrolase [Rhizobium oryziradicis]|uniref:Nucleoside hydrolase n=1 Tax=Rhizobium oryziradicis TaxID=1867956 RepID=A0A1Q8ZVX5_9HYPH|nr:nucleoside hydrolase [Rhizobium oryziradicis]OLP46234.1 nucleoside hydrolase [Rhizobium oryziradicis]